MRPALMVWLMMTASALAGEASVTESFHVDAPHEAVIDWLGSHQAECRTAMSVQLIGESDGVLTLRRENRRGHWVWTQRDTITTAPGRWHLKSRLVDGLEGGIRRFESDVTITADGNRTLVSAVSTAEVENVSHKELKIDLNGRGRRLQELLRREVAR